MTLYAALVSANNISYVHEKLFCSLEQYLREEVDAHRGRRVVGCEAYLHGVYRVWLETGDDKDVYTQQTFEITLTPVQLPMSGTAIADKVKVILADDVVIEYDEQRGRFRLTKLLPSGSISFTRPYCCSLEEVHEWVKECLKSQS